MEWNKKKKNQLSSLFHFPYSYPNILIHSTGASLFLLLLKSLLIIEVPIPTVFIFQLVPSEVKGSD